MLVPIFFVVSFVVCGVAGKPTSKENDVQIPCHFATYDMDGDENISLEEFLRATAGFTKMDPKTLYEHLDTNGDQAINIEEFTHVTPSLGDVGILDHCQRRRCWAVCIHIG
ncbi:uncharacterized protein LOC128192442 [Crassostrea angulata]|uniref:uncharacterized protein LOC128192442 n=1 Tax=Magallana angulata TaxID=2784310 RepID=UPI0022B0ABA9|nr:uncharacterized protein LOC128192442 [Crassostrea angulata]